MSIESFINRCLVLLLGLMVAGCSHPSPATFPATIAEGRAVVKEVMDATGATAVSVALVDGDRVIWSEAFGSADKEAGRDASRASLFGIASASKVVATVATMILVDQGKVALDQPVANYIANFSMPLDQRYRNITVRMLLNHSSGLPGNDMRGAVTMQPFRGYAAQMMDGLKYQRLKHDPGTISSYNNDGFTMVENLVKAVTGQDYTDFVRENIFGPLGMTSSRFQTVALPDTSYAHPYAGDTQKTMYSFNTYGSGGIFSTPEELARVATMIINKGRYGSHHILSEAAVAAMAQDQRVPAFNPVPYEENRFGLGWDTVAQPGMAAAGITAWQKGGDMGGYFGASIAVVPGANLGVVVLGASNGFGSNNAVKISERILLRAMVELGKIQGMPGALSTADLQLKTVPAEDKSYAGYYGSGTTAYRLTFGSDDSLTVDEYRTDWTPLYQNFKLRSDGWYAADGDPTKGVRLLTWQGYPCFAVRMKRGNEHHTIQIMFGQRLDAKGALSASWQARFAERWLPVNADPWYYAMYPSNPGFTLRQVNGVTGYLVANKLLRDMAPAADSRLDGMFLGVPDAVRDLQDVGVESWSGQEWLRAGSYLYRALSGIPVLAAGPASISIGSDGFAELRLLPASGSVAISGSTYWYLYDGDLQQVATGTDSGTTPLSGTGAKCLVLFGTKGSSISLNVSTP